MRAQQELLTYWRKVRGRARMPARRDIDPAAIKRLLPGVLLVDVRAAPRDYRVRLAGTAFYPIFGAEITGCRLEHIYSPPIADYWRAQLDTIVESRRPQVGCHLLDWRARTQVRILWLRLPLAANGEDVDMLLGYDAVVGVAAEGEPAGRAA